MTFTKLKKHILSLSMITILLLLFLFPIKGICETKEIIAEGEYVMGAGESMAIAEERAMKKAAQNAAEEAGAFVKSYSKVQNLTLAEDVVEVVANHAMKITVLDRKKSVVGNLDAIKFQVKIRAVLTTEEVAANLKKVREDRGVIESYNRLKADYDRQAREMEILKKRLTEAGGEEKTQVLAQITNEEKRFKANLWMEKAAELWRGEMAMKAYDKAIELNPALIDAYVSKAGSMRIDFVFAYKELQSDEGTSESNVQKILSDLNKALNDLNKAISLDKGHAEAHALRADIYKGISNVELWLSEFRKQNTETIHEIKKKYTSRIFEDINFAISLKPDNPNYYSQRSKYYDKDYNNAISDISRAIVLCREAGCSMLDLYYAERAILYFSAGKKELSEKDMAESNKILAERNKAFKDVFVLDQPLLQKSELAKLYKELYCSLSIRMNEKKLQQTLKELDRKISRKKGKAEDYILRADLSDNKENNLRDYSEAIRLLKSGRSEGENALLLTRIYFSKSRQHEKQNDSVLKELKEAQKLLDQNLPRAIEHLKDDDYKAIMADDQEKILKLTRKEAEAYFWRELATEIVDWRANIYEELGLPEKARAEYQYLCEKLKAANACKNMDRFK